MWTAALTRTLATFTMNCAADDDAFSDADCFHSSAMTKPVIGLVGCSASGKSTVSAALADLLGEPMGQSTADGGAPAGRLSVISSDDHYKPLEACPRFDLDAINWSGGSVPPAFDSRGDADLNHPNAVNWVAVTNAIDAAIAAAARDAADGQQTLVLLEGLLLFGVGAEATRQRVDQWYVLDAPLDDAVAQEVLWRRKWKRSGHFGKPSYAARGVGPMDYASYWNGYVVPRWVEHGLSRIGPVMEECGDGAVLTMLDCRRSPQALAATILERSRALTTGPIRATK